MAGVMVVDYFCRRGHSVMTTICTFSKKVFPTESLFPPASRRLEGPFRLSSILVRKVAGAMVLEAQKKSVKRQALMDRCLAKVCCW